MTDPKLHPLAEALGDEWRWFEDVSRRTVAIIHPRGLWVEVDRSLLGPGRIKESEAKAIASALRRGILDGASGYVDVTVARSPSGVLARLGRSRLPPRARATS